MDARESLSPVASAREEDDGHLSVAAALAKDAAALFQSRRYAECVEVLNQLLQKKEDDPKVIHNIAVAEYFRDGCLDPRKLLEVLNKLKKRGEDLARASGEQVDVAGNLGSSIMSGSKGSGTIPHQFSAANTTCTAYADEFDTSVATLNTAVILFHLHEYTNALSVLEPLYQNIEPIDETTAFHICLLLLDVALSSQDASKAADVIQYLEKNFGGDYMIGQGDNGSSAQQQSSNQAVKVNLAPSTAAALDTSNPDSTASTNASENPLARTLSDEALDYETLLRDIGGQNLSRPAALPSQNDNLKASSERPAPAVDLKLKLHLYKVRVLLLTRNLKATKREVKLAMNIARGRDSSTALHLKSQLEYARGNHRKAIKLLMTSSNRTELGMPSMFNNNLGCIYHQLRKHHTSTVFFSKALKSSCSLRSEKPLKLSTFSQDKSLLILYNCGLQYLACGKPLIAARCFHKSGSVFYSQPLLWLRLAECCLLALEKGLLNTHHGSSMNGEEVKVHAAGTGKWRQVVVENAVSRNGLLDSVDGSSGDDAPRLSIVYARQCLLNALHLLNGLELKPLQDDANNSASEDDGSSHGSPVGGAKNSNQKNITGGNVKATSNVTAAAAQASANGDPKEAKGSLSSNNALQSSITAYEEMRRKENHMIKQAVLADLAYVELCLENPLKALSAAKALLLLPDCSKIYVFLGHVYAAEALCRLNRPKEAAEQLSFYVSDGINVELPYSDEDREKWRIEKGGGDGEELNGNAAATNSFLEEPQGIDFLKPEEARGALYANLASTYAMLGDLEQAHRLVTQALSTIPNHPTAVLAAVYVDLLLGKTVDALAKLKRYSHVRFFPSGVTTVNSS